MKIQGSEVEIISGKEDEPDYFRRYLTIQFVKTPKGKRKVLGEINEEFNSTQKNLVRISLNFKGTKTNRERRAIIDILTKMLKWQIFRHSYETLLSFKKNIPTMMSVIYSV